MAIPDSKIQEKLSISYFKAVVSYAGYSLNELGSGDDFGVDFHVNQVMQLEHGYDEAGVLFLAQLKATYTAYLTEHEVIYDLKIRAYQRLKSAALQQKVLVLFVMPREKVNWLACDHGGLMIQNCAYFLKASDLPENIEGHTSSIRIRIPRTNIFNSDAVEMLAQSGLIKLELPNEA